MSKTKNLIPVSKLPFIDSLTELSIGERKRLGLILRGGGINDYRLAHMNGKAGSMREETWINQGYHKGYHSCCNSRVCWRHKVSCPRLNFGDEA